METYGHPPSSWDAAKNEARAFICKYARAGSWTCYEPLARAIKSIDIDAYGSPMNELLDQIDREEHAEGRPMLTAAVVRQKEGDPGIGFYTLAKDLHSHYRGLDELAIHSKELQKVHDYWSRRGR